MPRKAKPLSGPDGVDASHRRKSGPSYLAVQDRSRRAFSWEMQKSRGKKGEPWTGVRNFQARSNT
jgi:predicted RNA-binding protein with PUA-like domain